MNSTGAEAHSTLGLSPTKEHASSPTEELDVTETESSDSPEELNLTETNMVNGEDWNHITKPGTHDVLLGRGGGTNNHAGNIKFRKLVNEHKMRYLACSKVDKPKVARQVVALWRKLDPPGRFLARQDESKRGPGSVKSQDNVWYEVGDKKAREKASQCLRERTPDVIPYIKHLRDQQNAITEQGVSFVQMQMQQQQEQQFHGGPSMHHPHAMPHHRAMSFPGFDPQQQQLHPMHANSAAFHHPQQQQQQMHNAFAGRRNSMPAPPPQHFTANDRCTSLPANTPSMGGFPSSPQAASMSGDPSMGGVDPFAMPSVAKDPAEMSEMEYQQHMMLMQQNMMQQQMHMQRLHQSRMQSVNRRGSMGEDTTGSSHHMQQHQQSSLHDSNENINDGSNGSNHNKRSRNNEGDEVKQRAAPDRAISLMSLTPANPDDNELSLEDYRQQLEEYIANTNKEEAAAAAGATIGTAAAAAPGNDDHESDLEDDWEKERERALKQQCGKKERGGVNRNMSGLSCLSMKSGMSTFSGFTEMMNMSKISERDQKMDMARSACSNLSLMSELTDLSQNIDNLSLYDD